MTARTSSRVRTTGNRAAPLARATSPSHGRSRPRTSRYRKSTGPGGVRLLGPPTIVASPHSLAHAVEETGRPGHRRVGFATRPLLDQGAIVSAVSRPVAENLTH